MSTEYYQINGSGVVYELMGDEIVLVNLDSGIYYSIRDVGIPTWLLLIAGNSKQQLADKLKQQYPESQSRVVEDIDSFILQLIEDNILIHSTDALQQISEPTLSWPSKYQPPVTERYSDMQDLLVLDPIHEVDEQGWPKQLNQ